MRISDWSSDVCSSDLTGKSLAMPVFERYPNVHEVKKIIAARMKIETPGPGRMNLPAMPPPGAATSREAFAKMMTLYAFELTAERYLNDEWVPIRQLGRASCRERVCQYG